MADEELVRYVAEAKRFEERQHAETGMHMLLFKHEDRMRYRVSLQVPRHLQHHVDAVADWVIPRVWQALLKLPVQGESVGEFVNYYKAAIRGRVIDFFKTTEGKTLEREQGLPSEHHERDDAPPDTLGEEVDVDTLLAQADLDAVVGATFARIANPTHVEIVRRAFWDDQASKVVAQEFKTTTANVDQVKTRFRRLFREECERRGITEA